MPPSLTLRSRLSEMAEPVVVEQEILSQDECQTDTCKVPQENATEKRMQQPLIWFNIILLGGMHIGALYLTRYIPSYKWQTYLFLCATYVFSGLGVTAGAHRLWTHRSYKASLPLRIFLMIAYASSAMNSIFDWVRDHRVHHKFTDTDADPHNATRGFFFSHCGWLMMKKHPEVIRRGKEIKMDDILNDSICMFETKYHAPLALSLGFAVPWLIPVLCWDETWMNSFSYIIIRWAVGMNAIWSVNSAAHLFGGKPFNKNILPSNNPFVSIVAVGEGWHNYHHVFPWDYKTSEHGFLNITMHFIHLTSRLGLAHDLKAASPDLITKVAQKYGDGTHFEWVTSAPEIPVEVTNDFTLLDTLPTKKFNKHID